MQGFIILDHYGPRFDDFRQEMGAWVAAGQVKLHEDVVDGLEQAPAALAACCKGGTTASSWCGWRTELVAAASSPKKSPARRAASRG